MIKSHLMLTPFQVWRYLARLNGALLWLLLLTGAASPALAQEGEVSQLCIYGALSLDVSPCGPGCWRHQHEMAATLYFEPPARKKRIGPWVGSTKVIANNPMSKRVGGQAYNFNICCAPECAELQDQPFVCNDSVASLHRPVKLDSGLPVAVAEAMGCEGPCYFGEAYKKPHDSELKAVLEVFKRIAACPEHCEREYAGTIYRPLTSDKWYFSQPIRGTRHGTTGVLPDGKDTARYHNHPVAEERFSDKDIDNAREWEIKTYVITHTGDVYMYDPAERKKYPKGRRLGRLKNIPSCTDEASGATREEDRRRAQDIVDSIEFISSGQDPRARPDNTNAGSNVPRVFRNDKPN